jgi:hypothetical protein
MHCIPAQVDQRRLNLQRGLAVFALTCSVAAFVAGVTGPLDEHVNRALDLHGLGSVLPLRSLFYIGLIQLALAVAAYLLTFLDSRYAIYLVTSTISLSAAMHQFGGLSVSYGLVSLAQYAIYVAEGFILALLMLRSYSPGAANAPSP